MATTKTRAPIKAINKSTASVAAGAAADKARKAASKKALAESLKPAPKPKAAPKVKTAEQQQAEQEKYIAALRVDAESTWYTGLNAVEQAEADNGERQCPEEFVQAYITEQLDGVKTAKPEASYIGPMLVLRDAAKHYVTGKNGNPHCNDAMAQLLDGLERPEVVTVLIAAMKLDGNPYTHLNPGQQSMNLRNKARGQMKAGLLKPEDIQAAIKALRK